MIRDEWERHNQEVPRTRLCSWVRWPIAGGRHRQPLILPLSSVVPILATDHASPQERRIRCHNPDMLESTCASTRRAYAWLSENPPLSDNAAPATYSMAQRSCRHHPQSLIVYRDGNPLRQCPSLVFPKILTARIMMTQALRVSPV